VGVRAFRGLGKNQIGKGCSGGSGITCVSRDTDSVYFNLILVIGGNGRAIGCNWGVNCDFLKFRGWIEKVVIVEGDKV
jgi:hypothetical protein